MHPIQILGESAVRSLVLAVTVALLLRVLRIEHDRFAKRIWTGVLVFAIAMPVLVAFHIPQLSIPSLWSTPRTILLTPVRLAPQIDRTGAPSVRNTRVVGRVNAAAPPATPTHPHRSSLRPWQFGALSYLLVSAILLTRVATGLVLSVRIWRTAQPFVTAETIAPVRLSLQIKAPATLGHGIVLPLEALAWDEATLTATLAHEAEHVREGDFYLQLAATLHLCLFWISPLAWWLRVKLVSLSETLCDRAAIARTGDGLSYAELLLRFANVGRAPTGMVAMAHASGLSERIDRLLSDAQFSQLRTVRRGRAVAALAGIAACALASAATLRLLAPQVLVLASPQAPAAPSVAATPALAAKPSPDVVPDGAPQVVRDTENVTRDDTDQGDIEFDNEASDGFTICEPKETTCSFGGHTVSVPGQHPAGVLLFQRNDKIYMIDDPAVLKRAHEAFAPVAQLAKEQGELAARQGFFGVDQGELGALTAKLAAEEAKIAESAAQMQSQLRIEMPKDFAKDVQVMTNAKVKLSLDHDKLSQQDIAALQKQASEARAQFDRDMQQFRIDEKKWNEEWSSHMREQSEKLRKEMEPLEKQIREQAAKQAALGTKQAELGSRQAELGRKQREASRQAEQGIRSLLDQAVTNGIAKPLP